MIWCRCAVNVISTEYRGGNMKRFLKFIDPNDIKMSCLPGFECCFPNLREKTRFLCFVAIFQLPIAIILAVIFILTERG